MFKDTNRNNKGQFIKGYVPKTAFKKGVTFSIEHKKNIGKSKIGNQSAKGYKHSTEAKIKIGNAKKGENNYRWKDGVKRGKHSSPEYRQWRSDVFTRDKWTCQTCGARGIYLEAHHLMSFAHHPELRFILENGVTLCRECHKLTDNYKGKNNAIQRYKRRSDSFI